MKTSSIISLLILFFALQAQGLFAQSQGPLLKKEKHHLNKEIEDALGYTQAIKVGNMVYISGITSGGDGATQMKNVYDALRKVLESYDLDFGNVVKENLYSTNIEEIKPHLEVRKAFYKGDYPAASWVEVKGLYDPNAKLEVELIAVIP